MSNINTTNQLPNLPKGQHPGFANVKAKPGVYRCKLWPATSKRDPKHADFKGVLQLTGSKASVMIWVHIDGSLGLRLEKIVERAKPVSLNGTTGA